jgi:hypothetical protein
MNKTAVPYALASAALFGMSTPAAKALLGSLHPGVLAGLLCDGSRSPSPSAASPVRS